ncbi:MAG: hypothetical protein M3Z21_08415, partial [Pseudomonadota bacterium]|nr:hypothetical protein [Pseudomonadota bacterium]
MPDQGRYDLATIRLPRLSGRALQWLTALVESPASRWLVAGRLLRDSGIQTLRRLDLPEAPAFLPPLPCAPGTGPADSAA